MSDDHDITRLRTAEPEPEDGLEEVSRELRHRLDPNSVAPRQGMLEMPWSASARARATAHQASLEARLDIFRDDLRSIRIANEVLNRAATMRAVSAAEAAIFEIRTTGETLRYALLSQAQFEMTKQFTAHLARLESFRDRLPVEVIDALKERALAEFTTSMNRAARSDLEFDKPQILRLKREADK
jgi:hypothetical protein